MKHDDARAVLERMANGGPPFGAAMARGLLAHFDEQARQLAALLERSTVRADGWHREIEARLREVATAHGRKLLDIARTGRFNEGALADTASPLASLCVTLARAEDTKGLELPGAAARRAAALGAGHFEVDASTPLSELEAALLVLAKFKDHALSPTVQAAVGTVVAALDEAGRKELEVLELLGYPGEESSVDVLEAARRSSDEVHRLRLELEAAKGRIDTLEAAAELLEQGRRAFADQRDDYRERWEREAEEHAQTKRSRDRAAAAAEGKLRELEEEQDAHRRTRRELEELRRR